MSLEEQGRTALIRTVNTVGSCFARETEILGEEQRESSSSLVRFGICQARGVKGERLNSRTIRGLLRSRRQSAKVPPHPSTTALLEGGNFP